MGSRFSKKRCQEKFFPLELKAGENSLGIQPPPSRLPITLRPSVPLNCRADHGKPVSRCSFPSYTGWFFRTARSRQGRAARRGEANPLRRGPVLKGWRKRETRRSISEAQQAKRKQPACACVNHSSI